MVKKSRVVIIGGGFGGIAAALELEKYSQNFEITLVSDTSHFEYHAALYRIVTGRSPLEVCIPLSDIFEGKNINVIEDRVIDVDQKKQIAISKNGKFPYDSLIVAVGSQSEYHNIPGLEEYSFSLKNINDALRLKRHLHELFSASHDGTTEPIHIVIAGGGASGVEIAGELSQYARKLAHYHSISQQRVVIDLFESGKRLLSNASHWASRLAYQRLRRLGVNIFLNAPITKEDIKNVYLSTMQLRTKTLIWTAGTKGNSFLEKLRGALRSDNGQVIVDNQLKAKDLKNVFVIGDSAHTRYSGMAQTAISDARFVTNVLLAQQNGLELPNYQPQAPLLSLPIGRGWALLDTKGLRLSGSLGWIMRRFADFHVFSSFLPLNKALIAFEDGRQLTENCPICSKENA